MRDLRQPQGPLAKHLKVRDCFNKMSKEKSLVTYLVGFKLSELESISIDDRLGARDK